MTHFERTEMNYYLLILNLPALCPHPLFFELFTRIFQGKCIAPNSNHPRKQLSRGLAERRYAGELVAQNQCVDFIGALVGTYRFQIVGVAQWRVIQGDAVAA